MQLTNKIKGVSSAKDKIASKVRATAKESDTPQLLTTWGELAAVEIKQGEHILHELERGELGMIAAVTNGGKSTLIRNLCLALACGGNFLPVVKATSPRRVSLWDFETSPARLQLDLQRMTVPFTPAQKRLIETNLSLCVALDRRNWLNDEPLSLSNPAHLNFLRMNAVASKSDLIIIDTISAAFSVSEENSNSEVATKILKPLVKLARETDAAVLFAHHIGKTNEDSKASEGAYRARGASSFGAFCGLVLNLTKDGSDKTRRMLSNPKAKGFEFDDATLQLDPESRWFSVIGSPVNASKTSYDMVVELVRNRGVMKRHEVITALSGEVAGRTVEDCLSRAVRNGDLVMPKRGLYSLSATSADPIGSAETAETQQ